VTTEMRIMRLAHGADLPLPAYQSALAAGLDLVAAVPSGTPVEIATGIAIALPPGNEGQVRPRSGLAIRHGITVLNAPGTIDADYRGELQVILVNHGSETFVVQRGMRIAQLVIAPIQHTKIVESESLDSTARAAGGFGSTGIASNIANKRD
jgi:dUTP pyrophosphatase